MAKESEQPTPKLPTASWLLIAVAVGALWFKDAPLQGSRPADAEKSQQQYSGEQDVDARHWQDPLAAVEHYLRNEKNGVTSALERHSPAALKAAISDKQGEVIILGIPIRGAPYFENAESRRRARYAVVSGLGAEEFVPYDEEHLGYVRVALPRPNVVKLADCTARGADCDAVDIPYEWFSSRTNPPRQVLLMWLDDEKFRQRPLRLINHFLQEILPDKAYCKDNPLVKDCLNLSIRMLGPRGSTHFRDLLGELMLDWCNNSHAESKHKLVFYSYSATGTDQQLFDTARARIRTRDAACDEKLKDKQLGIHDSADLLARETVKSQVEIFRTIHTDDKLAETIATELKRRGVNLADQDDQSHIALVSEWDTLYGRSLPKALCSALVAPLDNKQSPCDPEASFSNRQAIHFYSYLRGLDGQTVGDTAQKSSSEASGDAAKKKSSERPDPSLIERPEGQGQFDYLRRLADAVEATDNELRGGKQPGRIRAIGVLGSDVYDKLLVLQVLRPRFPDAIFFTTDMDARLLHPSENKWTRNLIIASSFGLQAAPEIQRGIPPFRDGYQSAAFLSTRLALQDSRSDKKETLSQASINTRIATPRLFEVGRSLAVDLSKSASTGTVHLSADTFASPGFVILCGMTATLLVALSVALFLAVYIGTGRRKVAKLMAGLVSLLCFRKRARTRRYLSRYHVYANQLGRTTTHYWILTSWLAFVGLAIWLVPQFLDGLQKTLTEASEGEPFYFFQGVSIWPTEFMRIVACGLALWFIGRGWSKLESNRRAIIHEFDLTRTQRAIEQEISQNAARRDRADQVTTSWRIKATRILHRVMRFYRSAFSYKLRNPLKLSNEDVSEQRYRLPPHAISFWRKYVYLNRWHVRVARILVFLLAFSAFSLLIVAIFGRPSVPYRGAISLAVDRTVLTLSVLAFQFLTFAAVDATLLSYKLVSELRSLRTIWPLHTREQMAKKLRIKLSGPYNDLAQRVIDEWIDIKIVAKRTTVVTNLIYYPIIVLILLILARNRFFDNWTMTTSLIIIFSTSALMLIGSAVSLRHAAETSRQHALKVFHDGLFELKAGGERGKTLTEQISAMKLEIENLSEGAFARFSQQPLVRSALLLVGSVGGTSLLEFFAVFNF